MYKPFCIFFIVKELEAISSHFSPGQVQVRYMKYKPIACCSSQFRFFYHTVAARGAWISVTVVLI